MGPGDYVPGPKSNRERKKQRNKRGKALKVRPMAFRPCYQLVSSWLAVFLENGSKDFLAFLHEGSAR